MKHPPPTASERWSLVFNSLQRVGDLIELTCDEFFDWPDISGDHIVVEIDMGDETRQTTMDISLLDVMRPDLDDVLYDQVMDVLDWLKGPDFYG